jgi:hypothetical protein
VTLGRPGDVTVGTGRCIRETDAALLVLLMDISDDVDLKLANNELWIPKSQISDDSEVYGLDDEGQVLVTGWWARKQGWT